MRGVRGGAANSFLAASVLASALSGGERERETLVVSLHVLDTRGIHVCVYANNVFKYQNDTLHWQNEDICEKVFQFF